LISSNKEKRNSLISMKLFAQDATNRSRTMKKYLLLIATRGAPTTSHVSKR
jgi:hypothetical protein